MVMYQLEANEDYYERLRDGYGDYDEETESYEWPKERVVSLVENGIWTLSEGRGGMVTVRDDSGRIVKGSPAPLSLNHSSYSDVVREIRGILATTVLENRSYDVFFVQLMKSIQKGDVRAMKLFAEIFLGRPPEISASLNMTKSQIDIMFQESLMPKPEERQL
tara:strand:+ start:3719 stop:4207 length:489 start_codon:yes stop_codon:yes gene_type:complete